MTIDEIDARYRAAVLTAEREGAGEWDDPGTDDPDEEDA
ncbi:MAG: hypothetical protein QOE86_638 [Solirubrobacteraceae bacterium]|jgi:hypothetical protein|nr:hypothetical protein [Solirubrobacteraceae bacterium]